MAYKQYIVAGVIRRCYGLGSVLMYIITGGSCYGGWVREIAVVHLEVAMVQAFCYYRITSHISLTHILAASQLGDILLANRGSENC